MSAWPKRTIIRCDATRTLPNDASLNAIFGVPANGRLVLDVGAYLFEAMLHLTSMSGASGNAKVDLVGAGTAVTGAWLWHAVGVDDSAPTGPLAQTGSWAVTKASGPALLVAGAGTAMGAHLRGTFEVTAAGTVVPSIQLANAAAAVVSVGSFLTVERVAASVSLAYQGSWD